MAVTSGTRIKYEFMVGGGSPLLISLPEASDSTGWDQGTLCVLDSSGHVTKMATGNASTGLHCIALESMTSTADGTEVKPFLIVTPQTVFSAVVAHATTASALVQATQVGNCYSITSSATVCPSTNAYVMDLAASGTIGGYVIGNKDATGTAYGRNLFIFKGLFTQHSAWGWSTTYFSVTS